MRTTGFLILLLTLLLITGGTLAYLSYGIAQPGVTSGPLQGLGAPATVSLADDNIPLVYAANELDAYRALGFAHGRKHAWSLALWRQTAAGRLAEWFGPSQLPLDRFTRGIGLAETARRAFAGLSDEDRAVLEAYAGGVRSSFVLRDVQQADQFVLLNLDPEPWEAWHCLLLERLFGWLTMPALVDTLAGRSEELTALFEGDLRLRRWLRVSDGTDGMVWLRPDSTDTSLHVRLVAGASALPVYEEFALFWQNRRFWGVATPGWPAAFVGRTDSTAWGMLPTARPVLAPLRVRPDSLPLAYQRIRTGPAGDEELLVTRLADDARFVGTGSFRQYPDSVIAFGLSWSGLGDTSNWPTWRRLANGGRLAAFPMAPMAGILLDRGGGYRLTGGLDHRKTAGSAVLVTQSPYAEDLARQVYAWSGASEAGRASAGTFSSWAARWAPLLVERARGHSEVSENPPARAALGYLDNWDYRYDRSSIGAGIFDRWIAILGPIGPAELALDSTGARAARTLRSTIDGLVAEFGTDLTQWRWENLQPSALLQPVWSDEEFSQSRGSLPAADKYAPAAAPRAGHPSALVYAAASDQPGGPRPAAWSGWMSTREWDLIHVNGRMRRSDELLGRFRMGNLDDVRQLDLASPVARSSARLNPPTP